MGCLSPLRFVRHDGAGQSRPVSPFFIEESPLFQRLEAVGFVVFQETQQSRFFTTLLIMYQNAIRKIVMLGGGNVKHLHFFCRHAYICNRYRLQGVVFFIMQVQHVVFA